MQSDQLQDYSFDQAQEAFAKYPYFVYPAVAALANASAAQRPVLLRRIAACVGDEAALRTLLGIDPEEFSSFYPDMQPPELSTADTIDSFLERFAPDTPRVDEAKEDIIAAPAIDYAAMIDDDEEEGDAEAPADATSDAISAFLAAVPPKTSRKHAPAAPEPEPEPEPAPIPHDANLSESLVRVMVKNGNYRKALEIITELSLNNPKKSIYFADQMRFLRKLIANQERKAMHNP